MVVLGKTITFVRLINDTNNKTIISMIKKERFFAVQRVLKFVALLALAMPLALASCSSSSDSDSDDDEEWGEDYDPEYVKVCEHVANAANIISDIYADCNSIGELSEFEDEIRNIRYVEDVRFSNTTMFVDFKDFGTIMYSFYPKMESIDTEELEEAIRQYTVTRAEDPFHPFSDLETAVIVNQLSKNEGDFGQSVKEVAEITGKILSSCGIKCTPQNTPSMAFYKNEMFEYDIVFLITHGDWEEDRDVHWLLTSDKPTNNETKGLSWRELYKFRDYPRDEVALMAVDETHKGKGIETEWYVLVSERYIEKSQRQFKKWGKTIFFNVACQSLMGGNNAEEDNNIRNYSLAKILKEKGVGVYFGYDESNGIGHIAGMTFFGKMVSGMSVKNAYESLSDECLHNSFLESGGSENKPKTIVVVADLLPFYSEYNTQISATRFTGPVLEEFQESPNSYQLDVKLQAKSPLYAEILTTYPQRTEIEYQKFFKYFTFRYGFEYATKEDFSDAIKTEGMAVGTKNCTLSANKVTFTQTLTSNQLTPSTTYYYRAYFYDDYDYYYSNSDSFTTKDLPVDTGTQLPDVPGTDF